MGKFPKYRNKKTKIGNRKFDSKLEAKRFTELQILEKAGEISDLKTQVKIPLMGQEGPLRTRTGRHMRLTVDFTYTDNGTGLTVHEDAKGYATRDYEVRKAVAEAMGLDIVEVRK